MEFRIADTFTDSLARLTREEQKAAKTTAFDLQMNPANPGMSFHKLDRAKDKNFWSVRVTRDIRLIVHKTAASLLLCYVDHHDKAYDWAERRKLETHPKTGAAQLVEIRERVQEIVVPTYVGGPPKLAEKREIFAHISDETLLSYGVPQEWLADVRRADEESLLQLADHLPKEAAEALMEIATGGTPVVAVSEMKSPFEHPDAQRRFRVMKDVEELARALEYPWDKWTIFLHPAQKALIESDYAGPARVTGSAGTGKTIVALHRAVFLARANPEARVLLTTLSDALANALKTRLRRLISNEPRLGERIDVYSIDAIGARLYKFHFGDPKFASPGAIAELVRDAANATEHHKFSTRFLITEWQETVDAWQVETWEAYRDVVRLGRKTKLPQKQHAILWSILERVRQELAARGLITRAGLFTKLAAQIATSNKRSFDFVIVDEAQDMTIAHMRFFAALGADRPNGLFFAGDVGQRIFQQAFSWKALGIDVRERTHSLGVNYRTSHQIRSQSDRLLGAELSDVDGNVNDRSKTISLFNGPPPAIAVLKSEKEEIEWVSKWIEARTKEGVAPHEFGIFVRSDVQLDRARAAVTQSKLPFKVLDENVETTSGYASISTMHLAKGLEFRAAAVMACDDEVVPLQERIETVTDDSDLQEVYDTERHLLYVACTRARDHLLVTSVAPASEFLDDLRL